MSKDFRIVASAFRNVKLRKVWKRHGDEGLLALITLWAYVAEHKSTGLLGEVSREDVELMADWSGPEGAFVATLLDARLLDGGPDVGYSVHDWAEHNPYIASGSGKEGARVVDFRVQTDFRQHRKIRALETQFGPEGIVSLMRLWAFAAEHRTNGLLTDMSEEDIGVAATWPRADDWTFVRELVQLGLLDPNSWAEKEVIHSDGVPPWEEQSEEDLIPIGPFEIHGWKDWNPWRCGAEERSAKAKRAAKARHGTGDTPAPLHSMPPPPIKQASIHPNVNPALNECKNIQPLTSGATQASNPVVENSSGRCSEPAPGGGLRLGGGLRR